MCGDMDINSANFAHEQQMQQLLNFQADQIEMVLQTHRAPARVTGGTVTPRWVRYSVLPALGSKVATIVKLSEEIALRLGAGAVRISRHGPELHVEVPRLDAQAVRLMGVIRQIPDIPKQSAILGLDDGGIPLLLRLPSPEVAHVLVAGTGDNTVIEGELPLRVRTLAPNSSGFVVVFNGPGDLLNCRRWYRRPAYRCNECEPYLRILLLPCLLLLNMTRDYSRNFRAAFAKRRPM